MFGRGKESMVLDGSPAIIFFINGTDMTFDEGLLWVGGDVDFVFAAVLKRLGAISAGGCY